MVSGNGNAKLRLRLQECKPYHNSIHSFIQNHGATYQTQLDSSNTTSLPLITLIVILLQAVSSPTKCK